MGKRYGCCSLFPRFFSCLGVIRQCCTVIMFVKRTFSTFEDLNINRLNEYLLNFLRFFLLENISSFFSCPHYCSHSKLIQTRWSQATSAKERVARLVAPASEKNSKLNGCDISDKATLLSSNTI